MSNRATEFSKDLRRKLESCSAFNKRARIEKWVKDWKPAGIARGGVDVAGIRLVAGKQIPIVLVEAELRRDDPPANILKIWKWTHEGKMDGNFILLQAFTKAYDKKKKEQKDRAQFLAGRMAKDLKRSKYRAIRIEYRPKAGGKVGAGRRRHHAQNLAASVVRIGARLLPSASV
ncbi:MAG: hypothetical protein WAN23_03430 [Candidatus Acidiferrales bacterium]